MCKSLHRVLGIVHIHSQKSVGNVCRQPDFRIRIAGSATSFDSVVQKIKKYTAQVSRINGNLFPVKGSRRIPGYVSVLHEAVSLPGLPATGYSDSKDESVPSEKSDSDF